MKRKEILELKNKPTAEMLSLLRDSEEKLRGLRFQLALGKVKSVQEIRFLRKNIARIKTLLRQNEK